MSLSGDVGFGGFQREAHGVGDVFKVRGARGAPRHLTHRSDGETDDGRTGRNARLKNGIKVINAVSVGRDVLLRQRENNGELSSCDFENR